ncbi:MAG TPA: PP2C family protein-serine/threonine phosphatase [Tepidisphaeraceae bacterium]|nr:PP2C family protein-serine/threonine phosphatase [Tepidisphaeraceae bacterium]
MDTEPPKNVTSLIGGDWSRRMQFVQDMMRQVSRETDPQSLVRMYSGRMRQLIKVDGNVSLSRRDLAFPYYRITRSSRWKNAPNPWKSRDQLPLHKGGLLSELIYREEAVVLDDLNPSPDDPAIEFLRGHRSLVAIPLFDQGRSLNMVVLFRDQPNAFSRELLPEHLWLTNLFGRMTHNLVLSDELREAYHAVDRELKVVADIQQSLLPVDLPTIPTLDMAVHYQTSRRAGGDYYDFFPLENGKWGFLIADVSGHGTPAAVIMAVTHSIAHTHHEQPNPPSKLLNFINRHLAARYTGGRGTFVTAFYGIYDPATRTLTYSNAGHNPPRHKRAGRIVVGSLSSGQNLPLGIEDGEHFIDGCQTFLPGDSIVFYTDGITEARSPTGELYGMDRLDQVVISAEDGANDLLRRILGSVEEFTGGAAPTDDRTLLIAKIT